ncbi:MAG: hypothetical protein Q8L15_18540 [Methylobacter sp.]|nr:hypothetical protein [Methylobacter sp.]
MAITSPGFTPDKPAYFEIPYSQVEREMDHIRKMAEIEAAGSAQTASAAIHEAGASGRSAQTNAIDVQKTNAQNGLEEQKVTNQNNQAQDRLAQDTTDANAAAKQLGLDNQRNASIDARNEAESKLRQDTLSAGLDAGKVDRQRKDEEYQRNQGPNAIADIGRYFATNAPGEDKSWDVTPMKKQIGIISGVDTSGFKGISARPAQDPSYTQFFGSNDGSAYEPLKTAAGSLVNLSNDAIQRTLSRANGEKPADPKYEKVTMPLTGDKGEYIGDKEIFADPISGKVFDPAQHMKNQADAKIIPRGPVANKPTGLDAARRNVNNPGSYGLSGNW